jgi:mono/diheme cytochrome c family protein
VPDRRLVLGLACALLLEFGLAACGGGAPVDSDPLVAAGEKVFQAECARCHGVAGQGDIGPGLDGVLETFPLCEDQKHWTTLGSALWRREVGPTYGATGKPVSGAMPAFGSRLTPEEITQVVVYTRTVFGAGDPASVATDCAE